MKTQYVLWADSKSSKIVWAGKPEKGQEALLETSKFPGCTALVSCDGDDLVIHDIRMNGRDPEEAVYHLNSAWVLREWNNCVTRIKAGIT